MVCVGVLCLLIVTGVVIWVWRYRESLCYSWHRCWLGDFLRSTLLRSKCWVFLEIYSVNYSVTLFLEKFNVTPNSVIFVGCLEQEKLILEQSCMGGILRVDWKMTRFLSHTRLGDDLELKLPLRCKVSMVDNSIMKHLMSGAYRLNLIISSSPTATGSRVIPIQV